MSPVDRRVENPKDEIIGAASLVVGSNAGRRAQNCKQLGENFLRLDQGIVRKVIVNVPLGWWEHGHH